jgi:hypothetical protein
MCSSSIVPSPRTGRRRTTNQRHLPDTSALRLSPRSRLAAVKAQKKTQRIYRELGLQLRNKTPKRRVKAKLREDQRNATRPNETLATDFVQDQLATGTKLRVLTIVDTVSRFSPALEPRFSFRGAESSKCWKSRARVSR